MDATGVRLDLWLVSTESELQVSRDMNPTKAFERRKDGENGSRSPRALCRFHLAIYRQKRVQRASPHAQKSISHAQRVITHAQEPISRAQRAITHVQEAITHVQRAISHAQRASPHAQRPITRMQRAITCVQQASTHVQQWTKADFRRGFNASGDEMTHHYPSNGRFVSPRFALVTRNSASWNGHLATRRRL